MLAVQTKRTECMRLTVEPRPSANRHLAAAQVDHVDTQGGVHSGAYYDWHSLTFFTAVPAPIRILRE